MAKSSTFENQIDSIVSRAAQEIVAAVRANLADQVHSAIGGGARRGPGRRPSIAGRGGTTTAARVVRSCPVPGCTKPPKGPRFSWFCEEHRNLPEAEKSRLKSEAAARRAAAGGAVTASAGASSAAATAGAGRKGRGGRRPGAGRKPGRPKGRGRAKG